VGQQKYLFYFQVTDGKITAKASAELAGEKRQVEFKEAKLADDILTFVEIFKFQDNKVRIEYTGKVSDNEIKFTRKVAEFATEEFIRRQVEPVTAPPSATNGSATNRASRGPGRFGRPIVLGPDDKQAFPDPPAGFDARREGIAHGSVKMVEYESK